MEGREKIVTPSVKARKGVKESDLGGEGGLGPAEESSEELGGLVGVVVNRLLTSENQLRLLLQYQLLQTRNTTIREKVMKVHVKRGSPQVQVLETE